MKLTALLSALRVSQVTGQGEVDITQISSNSREVGPGSLFVAVPGVSADGHDFIGAALARGAVAVVGERAREHLPVLRETPLLPYVQVPNCRTALAWLAATWYKFPARRLTMIGVTGTDGKTSTSSLVAAILQTAGHRVGLVTTVNAQIGERVLDTGLHVTTPDAPDTQRYLAEMVAADCDVAVVESTSHGLHQRRVDACEFDAAVVTNITHEHLDYHGTWDDYAAAKGRLFAHLSHAVDKPDIPKVAVLNADDASYPLLDAILNQGRPGILRLTYGLRNGGVQATHIDHAPDHTGFTLDLGHSLREFRLPVDHLQTPFTTSLIGDFNVYNILAAVCVTLALGVPLADVQAAVARFGGVSGRMERIDEGQPFTAIVDFAHSPVSLDRALQTVRPLAAPGGRVIAVFGCAGQRDRAKRFLMGQVSARAADLTVITAEDPRTESVADISAEIARGCLAEGGVEGETFWRVGDRAEALAFACGLARPGDVVIACGKGHERSMCFGTTETPWNEQEALRAVLRAARTT